MARFIAFIMLAFVLVSTASAQSAPWYAHYQRGERLMKSGKYQDAAVEFIKAIREKGADSERERLSGTRTVAYYPRRELGVCLYQLGIRDFAEEELRRSLSQSRSSRAEAYLRRVLQ